jgi:hypothetical protein
MEFNKEEFLRLMEFPDEWLHFDMYPDELFAANSAGYEIGHEKSSEHYRNGAFHWWLKQVPTKKKLKDLVVLTYADPDQLMAGDVRKYIAKAMNCDDEVMELLNG